MTRMKEGSTFSFPPSIHGAVGPLVDMTLFYWKMNGGGALWHRRRAATTTETDESPDLWTWLSLAEYLLFKFQHNQIGSLWATDQARYAKSWVVWRLVEVMQTDLHAVFF